MCWEYIILNLSSKKHTIHEKQTHAHKTNQLRSDRKAQNKKTKTKQGERERER